MRDGGGKPGIAPISDVGGGVHQRLIHDSAAKHVSGEAIYVDDIREPEGTLYFCPGLSRKARARIVSIDVDLLRSQPGVVDAIAVESVPASNDFGHARRGDDKVFADQIVDFEGQVVFGIVATSHLAARAAAAVPAVTYKDLDPILTIDHAMRARSFLAPPRKLVRGDFEAAFENAAHQLEGRILCGGQEHFYLEPQVSMAVPQEDGNILIYCSTQDPSAVQHLVAKILGKPASCVTIETRRMGGGFGGKETAATLWAAHCAIAALKLNRPVKCRLDRDDDMIATGKRHAFQFDYKVGFDDAGLLEAVEFSVAANCGYSEDQSLAILDRAIYHMDGAYYLPNVRINGFSCRTNICSGMAYRGFGSPQANFAIERVMDAIAHHLQLDPLKLRKRNLYDNARRSVTHYDWPVSDFVLPRILAELEVSSDYESRRAAIKEFNASSAYIKRGIALMPLKYGVGFTASFLNQAGALLHIYQDGSVSLNHGGTEMGQGLFVKVAQIVAEELQIDVDRIRVTSTSTDKVPNATATAASSGTDMNGAAARNAAQILKERLTEFAAKKHKIAPTQIEFSNNKVRIGNQTVTFEDLVQDAYMNLVQLSAAGFYSNPRIDVDPVTMKGRPYHYNCYGAAVVEVEIDALTGENRICRADILHDVGKSLNPAIDLGQLEGGFVQGIGWLTTEELVWDEHGRLRTHAPSTYKIPACSDRPPIMNMKLVEWSENRENTVYRSKAIGEPPFNLANSVFNAYVDAVSSLGDYRHLPDLDAPATPERILAACDKLRKQSSLPD